MKDRKLKKLIKESFKDIALRLNELNYNDRKSLLAEYREWINKDPIIEEILMLPYEAYTNRFRNEFIEEE